jgi:branched-subunit amino acid ABC-type transport system permease component
MTLVLGIIITGLTVGAYYCLVALGLQMTYSGTRVLNFAQGDIAAFGGLLFYELTTNDHINAWLALLIVVPVGFVVGILVQWVLWPFLHRAEVEFIAGIATIGLSIAIEGLLEMKFGSDAVVAQPFVGGAPWNFFGVAVPRQDVIVIVAAVIGVSALFLLYRFTRVGLMIRANASSGEGAQIVGLGITRVRMMVFGVAASLSAVAGALVAPLVGTSFQSGQAVLLIAFVALVLGGPQSAVATAIGAVLLSLVQSAVGATSIGPYSDVVLFGILLAALLIRPEGIAVRRSLVRR